MRSLYFSGRKTMNWLAVAGLIGLIAIGLIVAIADIFTIRKELKPSPKK